MAKNQSNHAQAIREYLENHFLVEFKGDVSPETNLFESGSIDSYGYIELVAFLESQYKCKLTEDELASDSLNSLNNMVELISRKVADAQ